MTGTPFERYIAPARARPALWRLVAGVVVGLGVYVATIAGTVALAAWLLGSPDFGMLETGDYLAMPWPTLFLLWSFAGMALGAVAAARLLHRRGPGSLTGPARPGLRHFALAALVALAVYLPSIGMWSLFYDAVPNLPPSRWLALLPLTVIALLIQTGAEELVFRGYLMQQLAARFRSPLVWFWAPALVFGAVHYDPGTSGDSALAMIVSPMLFGLLAADLTVRSGSLWAAWGFHFANNLVAIAFLSTKDTITGLSLFQTPYSAEDMGSILPLMLSDMALLLVAWTALRLVLARFG